MRFIFWHILRDRRLTLLIYCLAGIGLLWMFIWVFPIIQQQADAMLQLFEGLPEELLSAFGGDPDSLTSVEGWLALKQFSAIWPLMVILLMVSLAGSSIAGEVEKGSLEIVLAQPISRSKIIGARYLAGMVMLAVFTVCSVFSIIPLAGFYDVSITPTHVLKLFILAFLFGWAVYSVALLISALSSERSRVYAVSGGMLVVMYVLNTVAMIRESFDTLKYASLFHYLDATGALLSNSINWLSIVVLGGLAVLTALAAIWWFTKRDIVLQ